MNNNKSNKRQHLLSTYYAPGLMSSALHALYLIILIINLQSNIIIVPILQTRQLRFKEVDCPIQSHTASKECDSKSGCFDFRTFVLNQMYFEESQATY